VTKYSQAGRPLRVDTTLGSDKLLLGAFSGEESVSEPFHFQLELYSEDPAVDGAKLLRTPVTITLDLPAGGQRFIHGLINRFTQLNRIGDLTRYRAEVVPWLWLLSLTRDCKIFQNLSALEIVEKVFKDQGFSDFQLKCNKSYAKREYCVQYRETSLNFVSRLMEEEGIYYFFQHANNKHTLILADANSAVQACQGQATARLAAAAGGWQAEDVVLSLQTEHAVQTAKVTLRDYDYLQPSLQLESSVSGQGPGELYDYPGVYTQLDAGERSARLRLESYETWSHVANGTSTCRAFVSGGKFELKEHFRAALNQPYMLLRLQHTGSTGSFEAGAGGALEYHNTFTAIPFNVPFRPARTTKKPTVWGSQTAIVVGKSGEEIWTDSHGRVKVHFHWDRTGTKNENSSCWVRVATSWAGKTWGSIQIPRMGQEVIVDFLEGDPDRPIITGRVYNAEQTPPYALPGDQTQSGVKSRSSKGGGTDNFNEIRLEDKKGSEQIVIHAEKDMQVEIEHDRTESVGNDESVKVGSNQTVSIGKDRSESVGANESITIEKNRRESVGGDEGISVGGKRSLSVSKAETIDVGDSRTESVAKSETVSIGESRSHKVGKDDTVKVGKNFVVDAGDSITIKTGDASISMKKNGDIQIKGKNIKLDGSGKIDVKASSDVNIKGSKVTNN
jgi:type VI secretion system secreted protein VgrG